MIVGGSNAPLHVSECSWGNFQGPGPCIVSTAKLLRLRGNVFRSTSTLPAAWPLLIADQSATAAYGLECSGCFYEYVRVNRPVGFSPCVLDALDYQRGF